MYDSLSVKLVNIYPKDREVNFFNMSESKHNLRSRKHLDYAAINAGKSVQFPAYGFSPDPRPLQAPVRDNTPCDHQTHDFTETKRLLEEEKERKSWRRPSS